MSKGKLMNHLYIWYCSVWSGDAIGATMHNNFNVLHIEDFTIDSLSFVHVYKYICV